MDLILQHISEIYEPEVICESDDDCLESQVCRERPQVSSKKLSPRLKEIEEIGKIVFF